MPFKAHRRPVAPETTLPRGHAQLVCDCGRGTQVWYGERAMETWAANRKRAMKAGECETGCWAELDWVFSQRGAFTDPVTSPADETYSWRMAVKHSWNLTIICLSFVFSEQHRFPLISEVVLCHAEYNIQLLRVIKFNLVHIGRICDLSFLGKIVNMLFRMYLSHVLIESIEIYIQCNSTKENNFLPNSRFYNLTFLKQTVLFKQDPNGQFHEILGLAQNLLNRLFAGRNYKKKSI